MNPKQKNLIETATILFMKHGIKRISIQEICETANVSKMTFYKYYNNKIDMVKQLLDDLMDRSMKAYYHIMEQDIPYTEKVELLIQLKLDAADQMSPEFYNDIMTLEDMDILTLMGRKREESIKIMLNDFVKAQEEGHLRKDVKTEFVLYILDHLVEISQDERLIAMFPSHHERIRQLISFYFYGMLARPENSR